MSAAATEPVHPAPATVEDVARVAGVSRQTVSRVANDHPNVAAGTRRRVRAAMADLRWSPDPAARSLGRRSPGRPGTLSGTLPGTLPGHADHPAVAGEDAAIAALTSNGFAVLKIPAGSSPELVARLLTLDGRPGVVVILT